MDYYAGHTVMIYIEEGVNRSMSISSPPKEKHELTFLWDISPMGKGCQWLLSKNIGDTVEFMGPLGVFLFDTESPRRPVFVATGTGISPFQSALAQYSIKNATVYWGLRHEEDIFLQAPFEFYKNTYENFQSKIILSKSSQSWQGRKGHIQDFLFTEETDFMNADFYLCGNGSMIEDVMEKLNTHGVPKERIKRELFFG